MTNLEKALSEIKPGEWVYCEDIEILCVPGGWIIYRGDRAGTFVPDMSGLVMKSRLIQ